MKKSKKSEQTYQQILSVSAKLFYEQGYEKTSIQDILNELKLSKGVVYYYFKSKKEILDTIQSQRLNFIRPLVREVQGENGREKITSMFLKFTELNPDDFIQNDKVALGYMEDPHIVISNMQAQMCDAKVMLPLFEEGIRDGSIETEYPLALAELTFMILNTWLNPVLFNRDFEQTKHHFTFAQQALKGLGADILSDEMTDRILTNFQGLGCFK